MGDNNQTTNLSGNIPQNNVQQGYQTQTDVNNVTSVSGLAINPNPVNPVVENNTQQQQNVGVPYTPENPTNSGMVTNNVTSQPVNVQQIVQQQVNTQAQAQVVQQSTTQPVYQTNTFTNSEPIPNNLQQAQVPTVPTEQTRIVAQPGDTNVTLGSPVQADQTVINTVITKSEAPTTQDISTGIHVQQVIPSVDSKNEETASDPVMKPIIKERQPIPQKGVPYTYTVDTDLLYEFTQKAKFAAVNIDLLITTTVIQLTFSPEGLQMVATDASNIMVQKDSVTKYTDTAQICVKADLFIKLVSKLKTDTVEIVYNPEQEYITLTSNGQFILQNIMDAQVGKPIKFDLEPLNILETDTVYDINGEEFRSRLSKTAFATLQGAPNDLLSGIYCSDRLYASNRCIFIGMPNDPKLQNESFFLGSKMVNIISNVQFNKSKDLKLVFRKNATNKIDYIIFTDGDMTVGGPSDEKMDDFPITQLLGLISQDCDREFKCEKGRIQDILDIAKLFLENNSDKQYCSYHLDGPNKLLTITTFDGGSTQNVTVDGNLVDVINFKIGVNDFINALKAWTDDTLTIQYSGDTPQFIRLKKDDMVGLVSFG